jgi:hypothetical protein
MHTPRVIYLVSSPYGDIPADRNRWNLPLEGDPLQTSYKTYFHAIKDFLTQDGFNHLLGTIGDMLGRHMYLRDVNELIIRSEKHGALYHPASIDTNLKEGTVKFGLLVAVTDTGRASLKEEFSVIRQLNDTCNLPYLPKVYRFFESDTMSFLFEEWFDGYHEFHISQDSEGKQTTKLWEFGTGYKNLSQEQTFEIYKKASKILTLYYDLKDFKEICPWHHAAGDFVVRIENDNNPPISPFSKGGKGGFSREKIGMRLSTARRYEPIMHFEEDTNPFLALFYFFLNLSIRMRLDRTDGVGEISWADNSCVESTVTGFFEALKSKEDMNDFPGLAEEFLRLVKSFRKEELTNTLKPLTDLYQGSEDLPLIINNLEEHGETVYTILQNLP